MNQYYLGSSVRLDASFSDGVSGEAVDPTTVTVDVKNPDGLVSTFPAIRDATGVYHLDFTPSKAGRYFFDWAGTGAAIAANWGEFLVIGNKA